MLNYDALKSLVDKDGTSLMLRTRRPGDRFRPKGMRGTKKLQDFFTDRKIPKHLRDEIVLLTAGSKILVVGPAQVSSETSDIVCPAQLTAETSSFEKKADALPLQRCHVAEDVLVSNSTRQILQIKFFKP